ncbi:MAG: uroporphyrinogen decarboxylase family protein [Saccharofermentanales bacterium]
MTRRERVLKALNFENIDRLPKDLGGMGSSGISCFAYEKLVRHLNLPERRTKVWDTCQMLAIPDIDVLDALDCDVVMLTGLGVTNAFEQPELWKPYDFNRRLLTGAVMNPDIYEIQENNTIIQSGYLKMPENAYVFDHDHAGQIFNVFDDNLIKDRLEDIIVEMEALMPSDETLRMLENTCKRIKDSTDRAVFFNGYSAIMGFRNGIVNYSMLCLLEPDYIHDVHKLLTIMNIKRLKLFLQAVAPYVDIMSSTGDDMGTQQSTIIAPETFDKLFKPYMREVNLVLHKTAPHIKTFMHSCGAIYDLIDMIIETDINILNPVQWSAGSHGFKEWKDKARNRLVLWGGGVNSQTTLPFGSIADVENEVGEVCRYMKIDGGYVFNGIHNILAEISADKISTMYKTAAKY